MQSESSNNQPSNSTPASVLLAWAFVGIPALWGVSQVVVKSMALFQ